MVQVDSCKYLFTCRGYMRGQGTLLQEEMSTNGSLICLVKKNLQWDPGF